MLIDSHHHLWQYSAEQYGWIDDSKRILQRDFWLAELDQIARQHDVDGFVTVQARQCLAETDTLLALAGASPRIQAVVGWVDFRAADVAAQLDRYAGNRWLKGLRHVVQDEPDDQFILDPAFNRGIAELASRELVYDILVYARQLGPAVTFARQHPDVPMVIDHIAKPAVVADAVDDDWARQIRRLAELPHVACKFSGVATEVVEPKWDLHTMRPVWDIVLDCFSPDRLMFGSDWPVCLLATEYERWLETVRQLASDLSDDEQHQLFAGTARRVYHME